jgi:hypothetical protein
MASQAPAPPMPTDHPERPPPIALWFATVRFWEGDECPTISTGGIEIVLLLLAFLVVLLFAGLGFTAHLLWVVAVVLLVLWLVGFALGRGESAGHHRFYRW